MTRAMRLIRWPSKYTAARIVLFVVAGMVAALAHLANIWTACICVLLVAAVGIGAWEAERNV